MSEFPPILQQVNGLGIESFFPFKIFCEMLAGTKSYPVAIGEGNTHAKIKHSLLGLSKDLMFGSLAAAGALRLSAKEGR